MLLKVSTELEDGSFLELVEALEKCPSISDINNINEIIDLLSNDIKTKIARHNTTRRYVTNILKTFACFPDKFDLLLDAINFYEQNSDYYKNLLRVVTNIAIKQQDLYFQSTEKTIFIQEIDSNLDTNQNIFDHLWSELCYFLDEIEWKTVWQACSQVEDINENKDKKIFKKFMFY